MENKDVNITFKLNTNLIIVAVGLAVLLGSILFCVCYNLPIFKKIRKILKKELVDTSVEPFSMGDIVKAPKEFIKDVNDVLCNKNSDDTEKKEVTPILKKQVKKPVVEGFFTNVRPN